MARKSKKNIWVNPIFLKYYNRLEEIAMTRFEWRNLPETCDERFLENALYRYGYAIFFKDEIIGEMALPVAIGGGRTVYDIPTERRAYANNGYSKNLTVDNSVIIYNNYIHTNNKSALVDFALELTDIDETIRVNARAQKTPVLLQGEEKQVATLLNLYEQFDGNAPMVFGDRSISADKLITAISTGAPYVADKLYELKSNIWNEALTYLGIPNVQTNKKERLITDEVERSNGGTMASRFTDIEMRRKACDEINKMFNLNISVHWREDDSSDVGYEQKESSVDQTDKESDVND